LKIAELARREITGLEKMISFIEWMRSDFMFGSPALHFANRYFSPTRYARMLKGFSKRHIRNAAWDLTLLQNWRRNVLKGIDQNRTALLMSGDTALKDIARRLTAETQDEFITQVRDVWGRDSPLGVKVFRTYCEEWEAAERDPARRDKIPKYEAQLQLIDELEEKVFV